MNLREEDSFRNLAIFWQNEIFLKNFNFWHHIWGKGVKIRLFYAWSFFHQLHRFGDRKKKSHFQAPFQLFFCINQLPTWENDDFWQKKWVITSSGFRSAASEVWKSYVWPSIISWSADALECAKFFWPSVRSIWDTPGQNQLKNGRFLSKIRFKKKFWQKSSYFSGGQKGPLLTNSGAPNGLRWWP